MRTALVTGAAGFTGRYVVERLEQRGFRVFGMGVGEGSGPDWISCDLTNEAATREAVAAVAPEAVIHLAAMAFVGDGHSQDFYRVNVFGTENLLASLAECRQKPLRIVVASSANVYGNASGQPITEETCPAPVNHYAASKLAMEHMVRTWFDRLPILITRPFNYTGPGQDERFVVPKIVGHFKRRAPTIKLGDTAVERDFSDVEDVVEAYIRLLESNVESQVVNICSGVTVSVEQILVEMSKIAGYSIEVQVQPELVRKNDITRLVGSNQKLRSLTGFAPHRPIGETLQRMYKN